ncbi:hypothetical protein IKE87_01235 [Candidatus Saccharibacteria bacterium]|nr:hypothetical protein [Candidatus Saccharibacteria bacterium]
MQKILKIGIGFVAGRPNVCKIINAFYLDVKRQMLELGEEFQVVFYVLYDLHYQGAKAEDFMNIDPAINAEPNMEVRYIDASEVEKIRKGVKRDYGVAESELDFVFGYGHAEGRNTLLYKAYLDGMDYLLFWDDDEYPLACLQAGEGKVTWKRQDNVVKHIQTMRSEDADVTIGYHCGYVSPIPHVNLENPEDEEIFANFIEGISNELVTWKSIKEKYQNTNGVTFADPKIAAGEGGYEVPLTYGRKFVAGSTLCINLQHFEKIPVFYSPKAARGEDTFFSFGLDKCKVMKVPIYHFHDGFLGYTGITEGRLPDELDPIYTRDDLVKKRFYGACLGWIKYKPLFLYISDWKNYQENIGRTYRELNKSVDEVSRICGKYDFRNVYKELEKYDKNVKNDYENFSKAKQIWKMLKK